ncbi:MAG: ATP-binding protein [Angustibacter sp.]
MARYLPRVADQELMRRLAAMGAVLIEGPKACGKTATGAQVAGTIIRFDEDPTARARLSVDPQSLFRGKTPILFDEWQVEPEIWNRVRRQVDDRRLPGQFILTGSARPRDDANRHSGAGRFSVLQMRPMSLAESGHSTGEMSLGALLGGEAQTGAGHPLSYPDLLQRMVIGGWPELIEASEESARDWLADYLQQVIQVDIPGLGHRRHPGNLGRLLESLGRAVGQASRQSELARDVGGAAGPVANQTLLDYLDALDRLKLTENSPAWQPHMRSRTRLRTAPVRYFVDPSMGLAALGIGSAGLRADPRAAGFHFEALAIRDLRIYAQLHRARVDSWRDANGLEVDAIVTGRDRTWAAFEVKVNPREVDAAAAALLHFAAKVDPERHGPPASLGVITSTGAGGRRPDGVHVIPIAALGP